MNEEPRPLLKSLLTDQSRLKREATKRRNESAVKSVKRSDVDEHLAVGWSIDRKLKIKVKLKRLKGIDERLENRLWMFFFKVGYPELNEGRNFTVQIKRRNVPPIDKQIVTTQVV